MMRLGAVPCENPGEDGTTGTPVTTGSLGKTLDEEGLWRHGLLTRRMGMIIQGIPISARRLGV